MNDLLKNAEKRVSIWCNVKRVIRRLLLKVQGNKDTTEMTGGYEIVPGSQSFSDLESL